MMASAGDVVLTSLSTDPVPLKDVEANGLTTDEANIRLEKDGPNAMPDTSSHALRNALSKFWAQVPWLLEAAILLEVWLHKDLEAVILGLCFLAFATAVLAIGKFELELGTSALQTLSVVALVFDSQATIYAIRSRPASMGFTANEMAVLSSMADILIISTLAVRGIAMAPLPLVVIACEFVGALAFWLVVDSIKIPVFARLGIS
jgi:hypothetical protein